MKLGKNLIVLLVALAAAVLVFMLLPSTDFTPYRQGKPSYGKYEPFSFPSVPSISGNSNASGASVFMGAESMVEGAEGEGMPAMPGMTGEEEEEEKEGFESAEVRLRNLQWGSLRDSDVLDKFSQVQKNGQDGADGCISSGLSNSGGYICLTPELIQLLSTRGGNATGKDSQIGAPSS
jgi:hypothetical protein